MISHVKTFHLPTFFKFHISNKQSITSNHYDPRRWCFEGSDSGTSINTFYETEDPILCNLSFSQLAPLVLTKRQYKGGPRKLIILTQFWREIFLSFCLYIVLSSIDEILLLINSDFPDHTVYETPEGKHLPRQATKEQECQGLVWAPRAQKILMWSLFLGPLSWVCNCILACEFSHLWRLKWCCIAGIEVVPKWFQVVPSGPHVVRVFPPLAFEMVLYRNGGAAVDAQSTVGGLDPTNKQGTKYYLPST